MKLKASVVLLTVIFVFSTLAIDENFLYILSEQKHFYEDQISSYTNASQNSFEDYKETHEYLKQLTILELERELNDKTNEKVIETLKNQLNSSLEKDFKENSKNFMTEIQQKKKFDDEISDRIGSNEKTKCYVKYPSGYLSFALVADQDEKSKVGKDSKRSKSLLKTGTLQFFNKKSIKITWKTTKEIFSDHTIKGELKFL